MNYTEEHFKNCPFNPFEENLFKKYHRITEIVPAQVELEEFDEDEVIKKALNIDDEMVCRYVIALYDPKSPLPKSESNLLRRKEIAAEIAGFDLVDDKEQVEELISCRYPKAVFMIHNYLRTFSKSMEWSLITSLEESFWEYTTRLKQPVTVGKADKDLIAAVTAKTQLANDAKEILDMYRNEIAKFYQDDKDLIDSASKRRGFTPEKMAKK